MPKMKLVFTPLPPPEGGPTLRPAYKVGLVRDGVLQREVFSFSRQEAHEWSCGARTALEVAGVECEEEWPGEA